MMPFAALRRSALATFGIALGLVFALAAPASAQERPVIAVVSYPLAYFAERLAGDAAEVVFPVPDGSDPSFWRPGVGDISAIQQADLIVLNGAGFAVWTTRASLPRSRIVDTSAGFADAYIATRSITHSHGPEGEHSHAGTASYTWLDFDQAALQADALAAAMVRRLPAAEPRIADALTTLKADLARLDATAAEIGAGAAGLPVITSHPRYQYFGRAYGLDVSAVEWEAGEMATEDQWRAFEALVSETGARLFVWEAEPPAEARDRMRALGMADVVFPPLASRPGSGDFASRMTATLDDLREAVAAARNPAR